MNALGRILLLASKSSSRKMLLSQARIAYQTIDQEADEAACDWGLPLEKLVESIATFKMEHAIIPQDYQKKYAYVKK